MVKQFVFKQKVKSSNLFTPIYGAVTQWFLKIFRLVFRVSILEGNKKNDEINQSCDIQQSATRKVEVAGSIPPSPTKTKEYKHFLAPNQDNFPLIEVIPGLWQVDLTNAKYLGFWDKYEPGDKYYLKQGKKDDVN